MALKGTVYRARIALSDTDSHRYESLELTLNQHPSETKERVVGRLLAYALAYQPGLSFTRGICDGDTPDIELQQPGQKRDLWIEAGLPDPQRIRAACKRTNQVIIYLCGEGTGRWLQRHQQELSDLGNLQLIPLPPELTDPLVEGLQRNIDWSMTLSDGTLYLDDGRQTLQANLERLERSA